VLKQPDFRSKRLTSDVKPAPHGNRDIVANTNFNGKTFSSSFSGRFADRRCWATVYGRFWTLRRQPSARLFLTTSSPSISSNISNVETPLQAIGSTSRLQAKADNLNVSITNIDASKSRIYDAESKEQLQASKLNILQQTSVTQLAQANASRSVPDPLR